MRCYAVPVAFDLEADVTSVVGRPPNVFQVRTAILHSGKSNSNPELVDFMVVTVVSTTSFPPG